MINLTVCIPTYNRKKYLQRAIESVLYQLGPDDEIIVGDNASIDGTDELMKVFASERKIRYYRNDTNIGPILNFHKIINSARGEFIVFLTDDDYFLTGAISTIKNFFTTGHVEAFKTAFFNFDENTRAGKTISFFKEDVDASNITAQKASLIYYAGHIATGLCFRKALYDNNVFLTDPNCWYPTMLILGMAGLKTGYLTMPTNIHTSGNETYWGVSPTDRKRLNNSQIMNIKYLFENGYADYTITSELIFEHFRRFDNQDNREIYLLLKPEDQRRVDKIVKDRKKAGRIMEFRKKIKNLLFE